MVNLPAGNPILLRGDVARNPGNFRSRRMPSFNADVLKPVALVGGVDELAKGEGATAWISDDMDQNATLPHAPQWIA